jgi:drug/metabolite transporter (DMT)-like permease
MFMADPLLSLKRVEREQRMSQVRSRLTANLAVLCSALLWGTLWIPLRRIADAGLGSAWATTLGFLLPLALLLPYGMRRWPSIRAGGSALSIGGFLLALSIGLYAEALVRGQVARVILLFYLTPVWSTLLARLLLGVVITRRRFATILLGLSGLFVILDVGPGFPIPRAAAEWMGLFAGVAWPLSLVYVNRSASRRPLDRVFVQFIFLGPVFFLITLIPGGEGEIGFRGPVLADSAPWLVALALIWLLPVIALTIFGASRLDPGRIAILLMLEIVVGLTSANLLTDEPFGPRELIGAVLIMGAGGLEIGTQGLRATDAER